MTSLMTREDHGRLVRLRQDLVEGGLPSASAGEAGLAGIFVPWSGAQLEERGGIYWVGAGTEGPYGAERGADFEASHERAAALCDRGAHARAHTPVWLFLDALTRDLLGGPYDATRDRWGWSKLLKIGWSVGEPEDWPPELIERQQEVAAAVLRAELARLRGSLIFVGSQDDYGILGEAMAGTPSWHGEADAATGIWWHRDSGSGNLVIHGWHPSAARRDDRSEAALALTTRLARSLLPGLG